MQWCILLFFYWKIVKRFTVSEAVPLFSTIPFFQPDVFSLLFPGRSWRQITQRAYRKSHHASPKSPKMQSGKPPTKPQKKNIGKKIWKNRKKIWKKWKKLEKKLEKNWKKLEKIENGPHPFFQQNKLHWLPTWNDPIHPPSCHFGKPYFFDYSCVEREREKKLIFAVRKSIGSLRDEWLTMKNHYQRCTCLLSLLRKLQASTSNNILSSMYLSFGVMNLVFFRAELWPMLGSASRRRWSKKPSCTGNWRRRTANYANFLSFLSIVIVEVHPEKFNEGIKKLIVFFCFECQDSGLLEAFFSSVCLDYRSVAEFVAQEVAQPLRVLNDTHSKSRKAVCDDEKKVGRKNMRGQCDTIQCVPLCTVQCIVHSFCWRVQVFRCAHHRQTPFNAFSPLFPPKFYVNIVLLFIADWSGGGTGWEDAAGQTRPGIQGEWCVEWRELELPGVEAPLCVKQNAAGASSFFHIRALVDPWD